MKYFLMIYILGFPPDGPFGFETHDDCLQAAMIANGMMDQGRVTCADENGKIIAEWERG